MANFIPDEEGHCLGCGQDPYHCVCGPCKEWKNEPLWKREALADGRSIRSPFNSFLAHDYPEKARILKQQKPAANLLMVKGNEHPEERIPRYKPVVDINGLRLEEYLKPDERLLTDEELLSLRSAWPTIDCPDEETATQIALDRLRDVIKAQDAKTASILIEKIERHLGIEGDDKLEDFKKSAGIK